MHQTSLILLSAVLMATCLAPTANAADAAEVLIRKGVDKRRSGDNQGALPLFQEALEISRKPRAAAQLGLCEQSLEMWAEAEAHMAEAVVSQTDTWVTANRKTLNASLREVRKHMAKLTISNAPLSSMVILSGVARGKPDDGPFYVRPGEVEIAIVSGSSRFESVEKSLVAGEERTVSFEETSKASSSPPSHVNPALAAVGAPDESRISTKPSMTAEGESNSSALGKWISFGAATVSLGVGAFALVARNSAADSFNNEEIDGMKACFESDGRVTGPDGGTAAGSCRDFSDKVSSMTTVAAIGLVAGASFVTLGAVFWALEKKTDHLDSQPLSCAPSLQQFGLACQGYF